MFGFLHQSLRLRSVLIWFLVSFFYTFQYVVRVLPSALDSDLFLKFSFSSQSFGQFSGIYYIGYALAHVPIGIGLDRLGPKKIIPIFILLICIGLVPLVIENRQDTFLPIAGRFLIGIGSSAAILGVFCVIRSQFEARIFSRMLGFSVCIGLVGAIFGSAPIHYLRTILDFNIIIFILIGFGVLLSFLVWITLPAMKNDFNEVHQLSLVPKRSISEDFVLIFGNKSVLLLSLVAGLMIGPLEGFADVWAPVFLVQFAGINHSMANQMASLIFFGMVFGGPLFGIIVQKIGKVIEVILFCAILMMVCFVFLLMTHGTIFQLSTSLFLIGIGCSYQIFAIDGISRQVPVHLRSFATSMVNMLIMSFGYIFHTVIGNRIHQSVMTLGVLEVNAQSLKTGITIIPLALLISIIGLCFVIKGQNMPSGS